MNESDTCPKCGGAPHAKPMACIHPWWDTPATLLMGLLFVCLALGAAGLCCGVMVRAYTWAAGD